MIVINLKRLFSCKVLYLLYFSFSFQMAKCHIEIENNIHGLGGTNTFFPSIHPQSTMAKIGASSGPMDHPANQG
jgi:hypothetical protein